MYLTYVVNMIIINLKTFMLQSKNNLYCFHYGNV